MFYNSAKEINWKLNKRIDIVDNVPVKNMQIMVIIIKYETFAYKDKQFFYMEMVLRILF